MCYTEAGHTLNTKTVDRWMDVQYCLEHIRSRFPDLAIQHVVPITEGWDSLVLEINGEWIFRFPRRPAVAAQHRKEIALLPALANLLPVHLPCFDYVAAEFVGYRKIEGAQLAGRHITSENKAGIAGQLADFLAALHRFPVEQAAELGLPYGSPVAWRQKYVGLQHRTTELLAAHLSAAEKQRLDHFWERHWQNERHFQFSPTLIHGDLTGDHVLYDPASGSITGIIDWGDAAIGDSALDFAGFVWDYGKRFAEAVAQTYTPETDSHFMERAGFYAHIVPLYIVEHGIVTENAADLARGIERVKRYLLR